MSVYFNQTNQAPGTSQFITRQEVQQGLSTLISDLSGANIPGLLYNPNPLFSTITMNPSGVISGGSAVSATSALGISSVLTTYNRMFATTTDPFLLGTRANQGTAYVPEVLSQLWLKNNIFTNEPTTVISPTNFAYATGIGTTYPVLQYNTATTTTALTNISSINGNPPSGATTFTNLTGSNLTTTGALTSPQILLVSSINGVQYQVPYSAGWTGTQSITLPSSSTGVGTATTLATITLPAGYLKPNTSYLYDVPIVLTSMPPNAPTGFVCNIGIRLGGNGQINYQIPLTIFASSQGLSVNLTGIAQTNTTTIGNQIIEIIGVQGSGTNFTATWSAPVSTGGLNIYTIKPLS